MAEVRVEKKEPEVKQQKQKFQYFPKWQLHACPRCGGDLYWSVEDDGWKCLLCNRLHVVRRSPNN